MYWIKSATTTPVRESVEATLHFQLTVGVGEPGLLNELRMTLTTEDGKRVGNETTARPNGNPTIWAMARQEQPFHSSEWTYFADVRLTRHELEHIERCRSKNPKRDVVLNLLPLTVSLRPTYAQHSTDTMEYRTPGISPAVTAQLISLRQPNAPGQPSGPSLVSADRGSGLFSVTIEQPNGYQHKIPSSDWATEYAPIFEIGKYLVLELPQPPEAAQGRGDLAERIREATVSLEKMRVDVQRGEWTQCAEDARGVIELLNSKDLIRPLFSTTGVQDESIEALLSGLLGVLRYANAFHHRLDKNKEKVVPAVNAEPEDAYLAFATAAALLNLVGRKLQKAGGG